MNAYVKLEFVTKALNF